MMSANDFDLRLKHIEEHFAARKEGAEAYRDQEMARLFEECEWTQEKIAGRMGKSQQWVSVRLVFGRFLKFTTSGGNSPTGTSNLTERRFRELWKQTKGKEAERFAAVAEMLASGSASPKPAGNKRGIKAAILAAMDDGQWYFSSEVHATVEEIIPGVTERQIITNIVHAANAPPKGKAIEVKDLGTKRKQYRLVEAKRPATGGPRSSAGDALLAVYEEAAPLIEELEHWGNQSRYNQAPGELLKLAVRLRRLFESRLAAEHA